MKEMNNLRVVGENDKADGTNIELSSIVCNKRFFDEYELESVEMDNGSGEEYVKGIEHYWKDGKKYSVEARYKNGKKEGEAILFDINHVAIANLVFVDDELNGECVIRNDEYVVVFRGGYVNGRKEGECYEYDESGNEIFHGVYRNGIRYKLLEELKNRKSFYCEYSRSDLSIISISQYCSDLSKKNGICYVFKNGVVERECIMKNGVEERVNRLFEGSIMKEMDEEGRIMYEGGFGGDCILGFIRCGNGREIDRTGKVLYEGEWRENKRFVIVKREGRMRGRDMYREECMDGRLLSIGELNSDKEKNGVCYEFEEGRVVRECEYEKGIMKRVLRELKGDMMIEYDCEGHKVYEGGYSGDYCSGYMRNGEGNDYDSDGKVVYEDGYVKGKKRIVKEKVTSGRLKGYYREVSYDGMILSICECNSAPLKKNGVCFEFEKNELVRECIFKNNVMERMIREFKDKTMMEYDSNGNKIYEGEYGGSYETGFIREGEGKEFDVNGLVVYEGAFEKGRRFVPIKRIRKGKMKGFFQEKTYSGDVISIGRYKKGEKNGVCYEFEEGRVVRECEYEKAIMKRVLRELKGDVMIEYDCNGHKVYEGGYKGDYERGYMRNGEGKEYGGSGSDMVYSGEFVNGYYHGNGVSIKNGFVCYKGEWKYGYPNGNGVLMNSKGVETYKGEWKNGYLKDGKIVIDFESGKKKKGIKRMYKGQARKDWWKSKPKCLRFMGGLLCWMTMIVILSLLFYKRGGYAYMGIRIAFNSDVVIHNCWEWEHIPNWWSWKVKILKINYDSCWDTLWMISFDLCRYKNLKSLEIGRGFKGVDQVKLSGLNELESVYIGYYSLTSPSSTVIESDDIQLLMR